MKKYYSTNPLKMSDENHSKLHNLHNVIDDEHVNLVKEMNNES